MPGTAIPIGRLAALGFDRKAQDRSSLLRMETNALLNLSAQQLSRAAQLKEQIEALNSELAAILGGGGEVAPSPSSSSGVGRGRGMSAEGRARIAAAARARWAKIRAANGNSLTSAGGGDQPKKKRTMSASARRKIAAAQRLRWAKQKAANKPF